jgi:hypothetical protein
VRVLVRGRHRVCRQPGCSSGEEPYVASRSRHSPAPAQLPAQQHAAEHTRGSSLVFATHFIFPHAPVRPSTIIDSLPACDTRDSSLVFATQFIFPHAPMRPITINMGMKMPGWCASVPVARAAHWGPGSHRLARCWRLYSACEPAEATNGRLRLRINAAQGDRGLFIRHSPREAAREGPGCVTRAVPPLPAMPHHRYDIVSLEEVQRGEDAEGLNESKR